MLRPFVGVPSSGRRLAWELIGVLLLMLDLVVVPLSFFPFEEGKEPMNEKVRYIVASFWTVDILASFLVGYHTKGLIEMDPFRIAKNYIKSWFLPDCLLALADWLVLVLDFGSNASALRFGKFTRGVRAFRLLRLAKLQGILSDITSRVQSEIKRTAFAIIRTIMLIVTANHVIACLFYGLSANCEYERKWIEKHFIEADSLGYMYFTSLHWSLTQFTPASMEVQPTNLLERGFTVIVLLFALVTFSSFVSTITAAMTHLRNINAQKNHQDTLLRRYLNTHGISMQLTSRVLHYFQERTQMHRRQARCKEQDVELFKVLPDSLKHELRIEAYVPHLVVHPMFYHLDITEHKALCDVCSRCITEKRLIIHDEIFGHGSAVTHMLFVLEGALVYRFPINGITVTEKALERSWVAEIALWAQTPTASYPFIAESNCELLMLSGAEMMKVMRKHMSTAFSVAQYGELFVEEAKAVATRNRWQVVLCNDFDNVRDFAHKAFEERKLHTSIEDEEVSNQPESPSNPALEAFQGIRRQALKGLPGAGLKRMSLGRMSLKRSTTKSSVEGLGGSRRSTGEAAPGDKPCSPAGRTASDKEPDKARVCFTS